MPSAQLVFLTLFLGLVSGPQPIALRVGGQPAAVEILLDGRLAARLEQPPWRAEVDLGPLLPRELSAVARDGEGQELGRASQWLNMPRPPAEVQILLERDAQGQPVAAQVLWQSSTAAPPLEVAVALDGEPLQVRRMPGVAGSSVAVELGASDPATPHVLSAELRFENGVEARRDLAFGGDLGDRARTELTAVVLRRARPGKTPAKDAVRDWLRGPRGPLAPLAVESGGGEVIFVRDLSAREAVARFGTGRRGPSRTGLSTLRPSGGGPIGVVPQQDLLRFEARLGSGARLRFLWPTAKFEQTGVLLAKLFDSSRSFRAEDAGVAWLLVNVEHPGKPQERQHFTDAVAIAGVQAAAGGRPRAVVLVVDKRAPDDPSYHTPAQVSDYLAGLRVPLLVWSLSGDDAPSAKAWGGAVDVSSLRKLRRAAASLREELASQVVVWVEGAYLPQQIELTEAAVAAGVSAAGLATPGPASSPPGNQH